MQDINAAYWSPAQTTEAIFDQMSKVMYLEIPHSSLKKERKLGEGEFGEVFKGEWTSPAKTLTVALKSLKSSASDEERVKLLQEAAIMGQFIHPHIVRLYGVVTLSEPVWHHFAFTVRIRAGATDVTEIHFEINSFYIFCVGDDCDGASGRK